jgi:hypothetical protein
MRLRRLGTSELDSLPEVAGDDGAAVDHVLDLASEPSPSRPQRAIQLATMGSLFWLILVGAAATFLLDWQAVQSLAPTSQLLFGAAMVSGLGLPLCLIWLLALVFGRQSPFATDQQELRSAVTQALGPIETAKERMRALAADLDAQLTLVGLTTQSANAALAAAGEQMKQQSTGLAQTAQEAERALAAASLRMADERGAMMGSIEQFRERQATLDAAFLAAREKLEGEAIQLDSVMGRLQSNSDQAVFALKAGVDALTQTDIHLEKRVEALSAKLTSVSAQSVEAYRALLEAGRSSQEIAKQLGQEQAGRMADLGEQFGAIENALGRLQSVAHAIEGAYAVLTSRAEQARAALKDHVDDVDATLAQTMDRSSALIDASRSAVENQMAMVTAALTQVSELTARHAESTRRELTTLEANADRLSAERFDALTQSIQNSQTVLQQQETRLVGLLSQVHGETHRLSGIIDQTLTRQETSSAAWADRIEASSKAAQVAAQTVDAAAGQMETVLARLEETKRAAQATSQSLAADTVALADQIAEQSDRFGDILSDLSIALRERTALADSEDDRVALISQRLAETMATLTRDIEKLSSLEQNISDRLKAARAAIGETAQETDTLAVNIGARLLDALARARGIASQAIESARQTGDDLVQQVTTTVNDAIAQSSVKGVQASLKASLNELSEAGERAAQIAALAATSVEAKLRALEGRAASVEARISQTDAKMEALVHQDFGRTSSMIIEGLNSTAFDVSKMLSAEIPEEDWQAYLRGDRGIFARRTVRLMDRTAKSYVLRRYEEDAELREHIRRFLRDFELLMSESLKQREGNALSITLLSSDLGKLYVGLAQSINRLS